MTMCETAMDYFHLCEMPADEVIDFIILMKRKGKRSGRTPGAAPKTEIKKRVYADQANWY